MSLLCKMFLVHVFFFLSGGNRWGMLTMVTTSAECLVIDVSHGAVGIELI